MKCDRLSHPLAMPNDFSAAASFLVAKPLFLKATYYVQAYPKPAIEHPPRNRNA